MTLRAASLPPSELAGLEPPPAARNALVRTGSQALACRRAGSNVLGFLRKHPVARVVAASVCVAAVSWLVSRRYRRVD